MWKKLWRGLRPFSRSQTQAFVVSLGCAVLMVACSTNTMAGIEAGVQTASTSAYVYRLADICVDGEDQKICAKPSVVKKIHAAEVSLYVALESYRAAVKAGTGSEAAMAVVQEALGNLNAILDLDEVKSVINDGGV